MKNACALVVNHTPVQDWELLLTPLREWVVFTLKESGISNIISFTKSEFDEGIWESSIMDYEQILVLECDCPYITSEDISSAHSLHIGSSGYATVFSNNTDSLLSGWYTRAALLENEPTGNYISFDTPHAVKVSDRKALAHANRHFRSIVIDKHLENGVDIPVSDGIIIAPTVKIGKDTTVLPGTILAGKTQIGESCEIGPNSKLTDTTIADNCHVVSSYINLSTVETGAKVGPMANIRPNCLIGSEAKIGDFVELKNAQIGKRTSVSHLSYLGDCTIGDDCNFGCGSVTVNYDGTNKHHTTVGNHSFIGCGCNMVAPLNIGSNVYAAAGSTITKDVPDGAFVIARERQTTKPDWNEKRKLFNKEK